MNTTLLELETLRLAAGSALMALVSVGVGVGAATNELTVIAPLGPFARAFVGLVALIGFAMALSALWIAASYRRARIVERVGCLSFEGWPRRAFDGPAQHLPFDDDAKAEIRLESLPRGRQLVEVTVGITSVSVRFPEAAADPAWRDQLDAWLST